MPPLPLEPITAAEQRARQHGVAQIARLLGFVGRAEYRHIRSQAGGAQFGLADVAEEDVLIVYAEAFERDADPDDFSLEAIVAHERGHQLLARHPRLSRNLPVAWSEVSEEIVASLLGSLLVQNEKDQQELLLKALFEADKHGMEPDRATLFIMELRPFWRECYDGTDEAEHDSRGSSHGVQDAGCQAPCLV